HLLTAAGAAGFIKTVLAMEKGYLPPSLNFTAPPDNSPLNHSRIKVQTQAEAWEPEKPETPRKAGVSAFGFGGINAHILVEEFLETPTLHFVPTPAEPVDLKTVPCAIVGMETLSGNADNLESFKNLIFGKTNPKTQVPGSRWRHTRHLTPGQNETRTAFMDKISIELGEFHIPPNQMADILPQHLIMLKAAKGALEDAGMSPRPLKTESDRTKTGCAIGIEFDFGATNFFLRWKLQAQEKNLLNKEILDEIGPELTFNRTLGALGGIVASRIAREFKLGGPCFTLSAGPASGIKALETAVHSLLAHETDTFLCGCVDLAGDIREFTLNQAANPTGTAFPSEGACALILKRLDTAIKDKDRIYGVIKGIAGASGAKLPGETPPPDMAQAPDEAEEPGETTLTRQYIHSFDRALEEANTKFSDLSLIDTHSTGTGYQGAAEAQALSQMASSHTQLHDPISLSCAASAIGDTSGAASLFSIIKASLSLYHKILPGSVFPAESRFRGLHGFTNPETCQFWQTTKGKPRKAVVGSITLDGACAHAVVEEYRTNDQAVLLVDLDAPDPALFADAVRTTARTHEKFLEFSSRNMAQMEHQFNALATALASPTDSPVFLDRDKCLEYAIGKAGNVLGPAFDIIDTYPVRVRLPAEPLMLVDRIMEIQGEMLSLTSGKIITQHDVRENAWYLDGGKAPVSISIEAGQADLFLCAYLGIDHAVKGTRRYRLLDAKVTFHRPLPIPNETIEYHIEIDRFLKQGDVYLFFFHYKGYIDNQLFISMRDGCAGFFTETEVKNSGGIILKQEDLKEIAPKEVPAPFVPMEKTAFTSNKIQALREGDLETAFGSLFKGICLGKNQWLPRGKMTLIDRIIELDPRGGRFGLGTISAEADIHADDWFLTCHFIDDMVMPGTLMYECCAHTLRVFVQRMGWVSEDIAVHYDVIPFNENDLKCRGPV
ncbi:MAG: beta-ketoacyl synthase, partial [Deltaproteobacteria bacterium]